MREHFDPADLLADISHKIGYLIRHVKWRLILIHEWHLFHICLLSNPSFLKSEFRQVISIGMIFKSHIGSSNFFNASIGIFLNSAAFLYSSENSPTSSAVPSICSDLSPPKEALVSKTVAAIRLFSFKALNLSPPSVKIQSAPVYQLYSSGVQRIKSFVAVARTRTLFFLLQ